jgi:hypothetical protein
MAQHVLKGFTVDNTLTTADLSDKRLILVATRSVDQSFVIQRIVEAYPGITPTVVEAAIKQFNDMVSDLVCQGYTVNTDLCRFAPSFKGLIRGNVWNPETNSIHVSITQGKALREAISDTTVEILGEKPDAMYIASTEDGATRFGDNSATAGAQFTLYGRNLKIVDGSLTLTDASGNVTDIPTSQIAVNEPKKLIFFIPAGLKEGDYTVTVTTKYSAGSHPLTEPHIATQVITIGQKDNTGGGNTGGGSGNTGGSGGE